MKYRQAAGCLLAVAILLASGPVATASDIDPEAPVQELEVILVPRQLPPGEELGGTIEVQNGDGEKVVRRAATVPGRVTFSLSGEPPWQVQVRAPEWWSPPLVVEDVTGVALQVPLWPESRVSGTLDLAPTTSRPATLGLRLRPASEKGSAAAGFQEATVDCPLDDEGGFECSVPAMPLDLRLRNSGFASRFFWDQDISAGEVRDLGSVSLRPGGSVIGFVEVPSGHSARHTRALLAPSGTLPDREEDTPLEVGSQVDDRGFFSLEGLRPGLYRLRLEHPNLASMEVEPIRVEEGSQTRLDETLRLTPRTSLKIVVEPAFDPYGGNWGVRIFELGGPPPRRRIPKVSTVTDAGFLEATDLSSGRLEIVVTDSEGMPVATEEVASAASLALLQIEVAPIWIEGAVTLGDEPVIAKLTFRGPVRGPRKGPSRKVLETNAEGEFSGYLSEEGIWDVGIEALAPPVRWRSADVEVAARNGRAEIDFRLPDTELSGVVETPGGDAIRGAEVQVMDEHGAGRGVRTRSQVHGRFSVHALEEGDYRVQATAEIGGRTWTAQSDVVHVEAGRTPELRLVLEEKVRLAGRVVDSDGRPLPRAWVEIRPMWGPYPDLFSMDSVLAGPDGVFQASIPASASGVQLVLFVPGHPMHSLTTQVGELGDLTLPARAGSVEVRLPEGIAWGEPRKPRPFLVDPQGIQHFVGGMVRWARMNGSPVELSESLQSLDIPLLPAGIYALCWMDAHAAYDPMRSGEGCSSGELTHGTALRLTLTPPPAD